MMVPSQRPVPLLLAVLVLSIMNTRPGVANGLFGERASRPSGNLRLYMDAVATTFPSKVQAALKRIPNPGRRLLAMKYYLHRDAEEINRKWAWSAEESREYRRSEEYSRALAELARVKETFAAMNPGYQLQVDIEIRSLASQIAKWNSVRSIGEGAGELMTASLSFIADSLGAPEVPVPDDTVLRFIEFLREFEPQRYPTVAVPGLSQHGQLRAFDFRIRRGRTLVAGASTRTIGIAWDRPGWTEKLCRAIWAASDRFEGPLREPYEPWHYEYLP